MKRVPHFTFETPSFGNLKMDGGPGGTLFDPIFGKFQVDRHSTYKFPILSWHEFST
jgi:hypothetical protein